MNARALNALADVICRAQEQNRTPMGIAIAVESAGMLQSPELAAELERLSNRVGELEAFAYGCDGEGCVLPHSSWCEPAKKAAAENGGCTCGHPQRHAGHCWLLSPPRDEVERLRARVAELEAAAARPVILDLPPDRRTRRVLAEGGERP